MTRRVTQQDIASRLGLDKSTVSLALRNHPNIAAHTRARVQSMAEQMRYRPDAALSTLARQRWAGHETGSGAALAYLVDRRMKNHDQHRRFLEGARSRAEARGYLLYVFDLADYGSVRVLARVLTHRGIRGVLVPQFDETVRDGLLEMPVDEFAVVCLDLGWVSVPFHVVAPDWFDRTRRIWAEVVGRGYRRVGGAVLSHTPRAVDDDARYGGSSAAQQALIHPRDQIPLLTCDHRDRDGFFRWFDRCEPDAVIGFVTRVHDWLVSAGVRVPEDVAFAALTTKPRLHPAISGMTIDDRKLAAIGVDTLVLAMSEQEWGVPSVQRKLLLEPSWYEGTTLPRRSRTAEFGLPSRTAVMA